MVRICAKIIIRKQLFYIGKGYFLTPSNYSYFYKAIPAAMFRKYLQIPGFILLITITGCQHLKKMSWPWPEKSIGGAVNVISRKPDLNTLTGEAAATYGRFDETTLKGYVSAPLVPGAVAVSLAGVYDDRAGTVTDPITGKTYNDRNNLAFRGILRAQPSAGLEVLLSGDYTRQRNGLTLGYATAPLIGFDYNATFTAVTPFTISAAEPYGPYAYKASTSFTGGQGQKLDHWGVSSRRGVAVVVRLVMWRAIPSLSQAKFT